MGFKKIRGVALPERKQGLIRYTCLNIDDQPLWVRKKFERLCVDCGGVYHHALREVMTTENSLVAISQRHYVSEGVLYQLRREFYRRWEA